MKKNIAFTEHKKKIRLRKKVTKVKLKGGG